MNWPGLLALIAAAYLISALMGTQTGGGLPGLARPKPTEPYYERQYRELDDINAVLRRPVESPKENINTLRPYNLEQEDNLHLKQSVPSYLDFYDTKVTTVSSADRSAITTKQPFLFDRAEIVYKSGQPFYYDARYPESPIPIQFATDPEGFIRDHPSQYPSYVIKKSNLSALGSYDTISM